MPRAAFVPPAAVFRAATGSSPLIVPPIATCSSHNRVRASSQEFEGAGAETFGLAGEGEAYIRLLARREHDASLSHRRLKKRPMMQGIMDPHPLQVQRIIPAERAKRRDQIPLCEQGPGRYQLPRRTVHRPR